jgi:tripartite ATP-independent transporter DctP family solute receptor
MKKVLLAMGALLSSICFASEFRSADVHPDDYPTVQAVQFLSKELTRLSDGKHSVKVFSKGVLGTEKDTIEQTKLGALTMTRISLPQMNNICPGTVVPTLRAVLDGPVGATLLRQCEAQGFIGLAFYDAGARSLYTVKKPVKTVAEAKGLKVRVQQSDMWVALMQSWGANATPMPYGEVYTALRTGLVDAAENNIASFETSRHFEVARYFNRTEHSMAPEMLLFSKRVWDKLSTAEQEQLRTAAKASVQHMRKLWDEREAKALANVKAAGVEIVEVDRAAFQTAMKPVYEQFAGTPELKALVQKIQEQP